MFAFPVASRKGGRGIALIGRRWRFSGSARCGSNVPSFLRNCALGEPREAPRREAPCILKARSGYARRPVGLSTRWPPHLRQRPEVTWRFLVWRARLKMQSELPTALINSNVIALWSALDAFAHK